MKVIVHTYIYHWLTWRAGPTERVNESQCVHTYIYHWLTWRAGPIERVLHLSNPPTCTPCPPSESLAGSSIDLRLWGDVKFTPPANLSTRARGAGIWAKPCRTPAFEKISKNISSLFILLCVVGSFLKLCKMFFFLNYMKPKPVTVTREKI